MNLTIRDLTPAQFYAAAVAILAARLGAKPHGVTHDEVKREVALAVDAAIQLGHRVGAIDQTGNAGGSSR